MRKLFSFIVLAILVLASVWTTEATQEEKRDKKKLEEEAEKPKGRTALRVAVELVRVDVTVEDKKGNLIRGLKKGNFEIYEGKVAQEITNFKPIEAPLTAVMVTEYSKVLPWQWLYEAWLASHVFVEQMRRDDWLAIIAYDLRPEILVDFTQNKMEAFNALRRLSYPGYTESNLYDTIIDVLDRVEEIEQKTAVILISSGLDTFSKHNMGETLNAAKKTNAVIYSVSLGGNFRARYDTYLDTFTRMDLQQADAVLKAFAKYTGGQAYFPRFTQSYRGIFDTISKLLRNQYSLGYVSTNTARDGKYRKIKVKAVADIDGDGKPDKLKVRHREGYLVPKGTGKGDRLAPSCHHLSYGATRPRITASPMSMGRCSTIFRSKPSSPTILLG